MNSLNKCKASSNKAFGLLASIIFFSLSIYPLFKSPTISSSQYIFLILSLLFLTISFTAPNILRKPNQLWLKLGSLLHRITNPLIMGIIFFFLVTPFGLIAKLFRKDPLNLNFSESLETYWISRENKEDSMSNQF